MRSVYSKLTFPLYSVVSIMKSGWGKVGRIFAIMSGVLVVLGLVADAVFLRVTDIGETLGQESKIQVKAKEYGMYSTIADIEKGFTFPANEDAGPTLQKVCLEFYKAETERRKTSKYDLAIFDSFRYVRSGLFNVEIFPSDLDDIAYFQPYLDKFLRDCDPVLDRFHCAMKRNWLEPYEVAMPEYRSLNEIHMLLLLDLLQAAREGKANELAKKVRLLTRFRRCYSHLHEWHWSFLGFVTWQKEEATFLLEVLKLVKEPSEELGQAVRQNLSLKSATDFKALCRVYFYMGADGFPTNLTSNGSVRFRNLARLPHIQKAWKMRIQSAAIEAYEAGLTATDHMDAFIKADEAFRRATSRPGLSSEFSKNAFGFGFIGSTGKDTYDLGPPRLKDWLDKHGF